MVRIPYLKLKVYYVISSAFIIDTFPPEKNDNYSPFGNKNSYKCDSSGNNNRKSRWEFVYLAVKIDGRGMWRAWGRGGLHTTFWLGGLKGGDH
jgi:hypothetical protein